MATSSISPGVKTFTAWADAVRTSARVPSEAEVQQAAAQFKVPLEAAQGVRAEMLAKNAETVDDVGARTKGLRQESQGGVPAGTASVVGIGTAAMLVKGTGISDKQTMLASHRMAKALPKQIDLSTVALTNAVPLTSSDPALARVEHLSIRDGKDHHFDILVGVPKDQAAQPEITIQFFEPDGSPGLKSGLNAFLAQALTPIFDHALSRPPRASDGPKMQAGAQVLRFVAQTADVTVQSQTRFDRTAAHRTIDDAVKTFDAGGFQRAEEQLSGLIKEAPFSDVRARAGFILGEMLSRLGRRDEAIQHVVVAFPRLAPRGQMAAQEFLARTLNSDRKFPQAENFARGALREGLALREAGEQVELGGAHFALGFSLKNQGRLDEAIDSMRAALDERPGSTATSLALAGYLAMAGRKEEAKAMFGSIPVPPLNELAHLDYHTNATWFAGVSRDKEAVLSSAEAALGHAVRFNQPGILEYFKTEPDLDWLRGDKDFKELLERFAR